MDTQWSRRGLFCQAYQQSGNRSQAVGRRLGVADRHCKKGDNSRDIIIRPLDTDNYEASYQMKVEFQSVSLMIVFDLIQISQQIKVEVEYGRTYYAGEIINLFQIAYLEAHKWSHVYDVAFCDWFLSHCTMFSRAMVM